MTKKKGNKKQPLYSNEEVNDFLKDHASLKSFVEGIDRWLTKNSKYLTETLKNINISTEDLMACFIDLNLLCSNVGKYILCLWIINQDITTLDIQDIRSIIWDNYGKISMEREGLDETGLNFTGNSDAINLLGNNIQWVSLTLKYIYIDTNLSCLNFEKLFPLYTTTIELKNYIQKQLGTVKVTDIILFVTKNHPVENRLKKTIRLMDLGILGGPIFLPGESSIFYDFTFKPFDCPILTKKVSKLREVKYANMWFKRCYPKHFDTVKSKVEKS